MRRTIGDDEAALAQYVGPTGKPGAVKVARPVWSGGKAVKPYLSLPFGAGLNGGLSLVMVGELVLRAYLFGGNHETRR